jgi:hypothetical protein
MPPTDDVNSIFNEAINWVGIYLNDGCVASNEKKREFGEYLENVYFFKFFCALIFFIT